MPGSRQIIRWRVISNLLWIEQYTFIYDLGSDESSERYLYAVRLEGLPIEKASG
jgi:hypothetical protein